MFKRKRTLPRLGTPMVREKMAFVTGFFYPVIGLASLLAFLYMSFGDLKMNYSVEPKMGFVKTNGTQFTLDGNPFYINGWNSYWLMDHAVDDYTKPRVRTILRAGSKMGLTVCRSWAFNDGAYNALQISPNLFDERVFQALDHVIAEARRHGVRLLLSLVNNLQAYGGKTQYVKWAWQEGVGTSSSNDSFFYDPMIRGYFRSYIRSILTRKNTITGTEYRDDPTIFAWELMNEPRCMTDPSGDTLQGWLDEMSSFVKSVDGNHLLTVGLEGFYGPIDRKKLELNPGVWASTLGSDFIRNSVTSSIDFASVHIYPDHWLEEKSFEEKLRYASRWMEAHIDDGDGVLKKPVVFSEFGLSNVNADFRDSQREELYRTVHDVIYRSALEGRAAGGSLIWQFFVGGMEEYNDEFGIVPWEIASTYHLITQHSCALNRFNQNNNLKQLCTSQT